MPDDHQDNDDLFLHGFRATTYVPATDSGEWLDTPLLGKPVDKDDENNTPPKRL